MTYGEGGLFGPNHQIINHNSKAALFNTSKLGDLFVLLENHENAEGGIILCQKRCFRF